MKRYRASGVLLHPSSLPGPYGIGDLGSTAFRFVDFLEQAKQSLWQVLPLGPTGYGDSPYASFSSFAGNPLLINLEKLVEAGDLSWAEIGHLPPFPIDAVDYGWVITWKMPLLELAARNFLAGDSPRKADFDTFCETEQYWLDDFALFMAVKAHFDAKARQAGVFGAMWNNYWESDIALRHPKALKQWRTKKSAEIAVQKVLQFYFFEQWNALHRYANEKGIQIIGDIPIFVAPDSVDVWANRAFFKLDESGKPTVVTGVPPDYFSPTGQLWGNPVYDWDKMKQDGYRWWMQRIAATLNMVDILRIDHFRGFAAYWEIEAGSETAIDGTWVKSPGHDFFETITREMGDLPIIAEDLGLITPDVHELRKAFGFPGMKVLQFAFDGAEAGANGSANAFLPHNFSHDAVVYTGTHDNDTTLGWYESRSTQERDQLRRYLARNDRDVVWDIIRLAMASVADYAIVPFQDLLVLGTDARMNTPSTLGGNWEWRYRADALNGWVSNRIGEMVDLYARNPKMWQTLETAESQLPYE